MLFVLLVMHEFLRFDSRRPTFYEQVTYVNVFPYLRHLLFVDCFAACCSPACFYSHS
jgi:hypothetical protein